ncbi:MAG: hypothetical protein ACI9SP_003674 [Arenicella sp.]|jgi:hypothetical protein
MFVGHYTASFIAKGLEPRASLGLLFLAAQFLDLIFFPLVLVHAESLTMTVNATASTHFKLPYMPFSHSLWSALFWSCLVFIVSITVLRLSKTVSLLLGLVLLSHWAADLLVHTPDLAVWNIFSDNAVKWGIGLWNHALLAYFLECGFLILATVFYLRRTHAVNPKGRYVMVLYLIGLVLLQAFITFGGYIELNKVTYAWQAIASFIALTIIAIIVDRDRRGGRERPKLPQDIV